MSSHRNPLFFLSLCTAACTTTTHATQPGTLGRPTGSAALLAVIDVPGPIEVETVVSATWAVPREGLINLEDPQAQAAGLQPGDEPVEVYFHALRHPERGLFLIDTGVERGIQDRGPDQLIRGLVRSAMNMEKLVVTRPLADFLDAEQTRSGHALAGVLYTHLHVDHVMGSRDVPRGAPLFVGPGEADAREFLNFFVSDVVDAALKGQAPLQVWRFQPDPSGRFAGVLDVLGDGSLWALWVPGHTPGSTAFIARTPSGPVLFTGDACHTAWGWDHGVEPGTFSQDQPRSRKSLDSLRALAREHPGLKVRLGHQARSAQ